MDPLTFSDAPRLKPQVRLQQDRATGEPILLYPEGAMMLNQTGQAILELCDGSRSIEQIGEQLAEKFQAPKEVLQNDVLEYLQGLHQRSLLCT